MHKLAIYSWLYFLMTLGLHPIDVLGKKNDTVARDKTDSFDHLVFYRERMAVMSSTKIHENTVQQQLGIAAHLNAIGKYKASIFWYQKALLRGTLSKSKMSEVYDQISYMHLILGDYNASLEAHLKAIHFSADAIQKAKTGIKGSSIYIALHDYDEALKMTDKGLDVLIQAGDSLGVAIGLGTKGRIFKVKKQYNKAIAANLHAYNYLENIELRKIADKNKQYNILCNRNGILNNIADNYLQLLKPDSALYYLKKVQTEFAQLPEYAKACIYVSYAEAYTLQGHYTQALQYFHKGLVIAEPLDLQEVEMTAYKGLATLYNAQGNYQKAFEYERKYVELYQKQTSEDNRNQVSQLQIRYALEKKDKEIARKEVRYNQEQLQLQQRNNRLYMLIAVIGLTTIVIATFFRNQYNKNRFLKVQLKNSENEKLIVNIEATLHGEENERERIAQELHDSVVSELLSLQLNLKDIEHHHPELQQSQAYSNVLYQTEEAADKLRRATHNMMPAKLKEEGLGKTIEAFINRISSHKLQISFLCYGRKVKLKDNTEKILLATTQELIQNVMKHAKASEALVQLNYYEDTLGLTVEDDGVGIGNTHENSVTGMGWNNIRRNVAAINGSLDVKSSEEEGTTVLIEIPTTQSIV